MHKNPGIDIQNNNFHPFNSSKILVHGNRLEAIVNEMYLPPIVLNLDVSGKCQYRCPHCHHRNKQVKNSKLPDLSERLAKTLPYFISNWNVNGNRILGCCIVGSQGDALLYKPLPELLKNLHFSGTQIGLVSNGYGYTDELLNYAAFYCLFIGFSIDAGTEQGYNKVKNCPSDGWNKVLSNVKKLTNIIHVNNLRNDVGWKILILPDTYKEIYESCKIAKDLGCRYVQIRPADLSTEDISKIDISEVRELIQKSVDELSVPGAFDIVGINHKFTPELNKILPNYCYLTALTATVTSDGKVYACVDRRCDESTLIADCNLGGWAALKEAWGSARHINLVHNTINCNGTSPNCNIRCSNFGYDKYFLNYFVNDTVDRNMI